MPDPPVSPADTVRLGYPLKCWLCLSLLTDKDPCPATKDGKHV